MNPPPSPLAIPSPPPCQAHNKQGNGTKLSKQIGPMKMPSQSSIRLMKKEEKGCFLGIELQKKSKGVGATLLKDSKNVQESREIGSKSHYLHLQRGSGMSLTFEPSKFPNLGVNWPVDKRDGMEVGDVKDLGEQSKVEEIGLGTIELEESNEGEGVISQGMDNLKESKRDEENEDEIWRCWIKCGKEKKRQGRSKQVTLA